MSDKWTLYDPGRDNPRDFDSRAEAEDKMQDMKALGATDVELYPPGESPTEDAEESQETGKNRTGQRAKAETATTDGGTETIEPEVVDHAETIEDEQEAAEALEAVDELATAPVDADPLSAMPGHFVDNIQGQPTINKKGYCVLAERFGISVTSEPLVRASETDFEYAEWQATATTEDGREYSGTGSAHIAREDGDNPYQLNEHAETRAMKRAVQWATGVGIVGYAEMTGSGQ